MALFVQPHRKLCRKEMNGSITREAVMETERCCYTLIVISMLLLVTLMMLILVFTSFNAAAKLLEFKSVTNTKKLRTTALG